VNRPLSSRAREWLFFGLCVAIFLPRAYVAARDVGIIWSDEIFQTLEQGHRVAFGYGLVPWEFRDGVRSWLVPGVIGCAMKLLAALGVASGTSLAAGVKLLFAALAALAFYPLLRIAYAEAGLAAALLLGCAAVAFPAHLIYSGRAMTEVACTPFLTWGLWLLWPWGMGRVGRRVARTGLVRTKSAWAGAGPMFAAGALLGLAALVRYQVGILLPVVAVIVAFRRSLGAAVLVAAGMATLLLLGGLLDWATWGSPFHSLVGYVRSNLGEGGASQWGIAKHGFYLRFMMRANGAFMVLLLLGFVAALRRAWPLALLVLAFFLVHTFIPHKELRFLFPVVPLFLLCAAIGLAALVAKLPFSRGRRLAVAQGLAALLFVGFVARAPGVEFRDIGQRMDAPGHGGPTSDSVWGAYSERIRFFAQAGQSADLCGLAVPNVIGYWTGGYTYLHRPVPLLWYGWHADYEAANYVLLGPGQTMTDPRYHKVAAAGDQVLYRRDGGCAAPPRASAVYGRMSPAGVPGV